jgi:hypothetical protein
MKPLEKKLWIIGTFVLLMAEAYAIQSKEDSDRRDSIEAQVHEDDRFAEILRQNQEEFQQDQEDFRSTIGRVEGVSRVQTENMNQVTGGDSYPLYTASPIMSPMTAQNYKNYQPKIEGWQISLLNNGRYTLYDLTGAIHDMQDNFVNFSEIPALPFGNLHAHQIVPTGVRVNIPAEELKEVYFSIMSNARNGGWQELLKIRRRGNYFDQSWTVTPTWPIKPGKPIKPVASMPYPK